jgi:hypothetical protein
MILTSRTNVENCSPKSFYYCVRRSRRKHLSEQLYYCVTCTTKEQIPFLAVLRAASYQLLVSRSLHVAICLGVLYWVCARK